MRIARERIERVFRALQWREWRSTDGLVWLVMAFLVLLVVAGYAWFAKGPMQELPPQRGRLEEMSLSEGETGAAAYANVRLSAGEIVTVMFPSSLTYRRGATVELHCFRRDGLFPRRVCAFRRYVEDHDVPPH